MESKPRHIYLKFILRLILKIFGIIIGVAVFLIVFGGIVPYIVSNESCTELSNTTLEKTSDQTQAGTGDLASQSYHRPEENTYLTFPKWYTVYSSEEYAHYLSNTINLPSQFPYFSSISQFWCSYKRVTTLTKKSGYPRNFGDQIILGAIGTSYSLEYEIKGIYENSVGSVSEYFSTTDTEEDAYAAKVSQEYADSLYEVPWYNFPFGSKFVGLWTNTHLFGQHFFRKWERKFALSIEYSTKAMYGWIARQVAHAAYAPADSTIAVHINSTATSTAPIQDQRIQTIQGSAHAAETLIIPRYQEFTDIVTTLARQNIHIEDIAGNKIIMMTVIVPQDWNYQNKNVKALFSMRILTDLAMNRIAFAVPVSALPSVVHDLDKQNIHIEHLYDY